MTIDRRPPERPRAARVVVLAALLFAPTAALAQDPPPSEGDGWIDVDEIEPVPGAPAEGGEGVAPEGDDDEGAEAPAEEPAAPTAPEVPPVTCTPVDLAQRPVEPGGAAGERVLLLPLKDSAGRPDDVRLLNDATVDALGQILDVDYPPPGQVKRLEDGTLETPPPPDPIFTERPRFQVVDARCLEGLVAPEIVEAAATCERSTCMAEVADATSADHIVYGQLAQGTPPLLLFELKLYSRAPDRIVSRATAEAPNGRFLAPAVPQVLDQLIAVPEPPPPLPPPPVEPTVLESPFFIAGAAVSLIGLVAAAASVAWIVDAELKLGTPEVHRDLKAAALAQWPYAAAVAAVSPVVIAAGLALMGASPFLLFLQEPNEDDGQGGAASTPAAAGGAS